MLCVVTIAFCPQAKGDQEFILLDDYRNGLSANWQSKSFFGTTQYSIAPNDNQHVIHGESQAASSGLMYTIDFGPRRYPILAWC